MNVKELKELIFQLNQMRKFEDQGCSDYFGDEKESRHLTVNDDYGDAIDNAIAVISATIPRETAKCKPKEAGEYIIAYSGESELWGCHFSKAVELNPNRYPFWLPMPTVPEATP